ncbi:MAG: Trk system potassium uptake protein TrkA [uncultured Solirubrobacteraceae bacterium]|uniref:Trk system potassium uptake protein TrkA n=1 Tax=uncultured Solirubrobacteraceae bacterium TaxID=1162706 RepID=A0A6J4SGP5_9ACTN|nr:MAG: Trk system potassium uptake protein TrkA [uncultured Solirubrobacteraceae bacterium]
MAYYLIVGAGRVGSSVARMALEAGHEVSVLDEDPLSHERLDANQSTSWEDAGGRFTVGTALEVDALLEAGVDRADVFVASTNGDNTNLVIAQIAQRRFGCERVLVRVLDPARAAWYAEQGIETVCPTQHAIEQFSTALSLGGR